MKDREKQIEEMAKDILEAGMFINDFDHVFACISSTSPEDSLFVKIAKYLVLNKGYHKQSGWVSAKYRLPEMYEDVLCCDGNHMIVCWICSDGTWVEGEDFVVTHWMPLPKPPKGE